MTCLLPRRPPRRRLTLSAGFPATLASSAALLLVACRPELVERSRVDNVRVLAVQKSSAYAAPGSEVDFRMLWFDGREPPAPSDDPVEPLWVAGCTNPPADLYYWCFLQVALAGTLIQKADFAPGDGLSVSTPPDPDHPDRAPERVDLVRTGAGSSFTYEVPRDIIERHAAPEDGQARYGVTYVFFAACAGELGLLPEWRELGQKVSSLIEERASAGRSGSSDSADDSSDLRSELLTLIGPSGLPDSFPLGCTTSSGEQVGTDGYVAGYSTLYAYQELTNDNPKIRGLELAHETLLLPGESSGQASTARLCFGADCVTADRPDELLPDSDDCSDYALCVPTCNQAKHSDCPSYTIRPLLDPKDVEKTQFGGKTEQMWVRYYASAGSLENDTRLVNDALSGFHSDFEAELRAPREPGAFFVWAAVHDSRGGVDWVRAAVLATEK